MAGRHLPTGAQSKIVKAIQDMIHLADGSVMNFKKLGYNIAHADYVPIFKVGDTLNLQGKGDEYIRQLQRQVDGLNNMTPNQLLDNLDNVSRGGLAQKQAREAIRKSLYNTEFAEALAKHGDPTRAMQEATAAVDDTMSMLAALHEPDLVAGGLDQIGIGPDGLPSMGDKWVNSSLGSQWRYRQADLRAYAQDLINRGLGDSKLNVSFALE